MHRANSVRHADLQQQQQQQPPPPPQPTMNCSTNKMRQTVDNNRDNLNNCETSSSAMTRGKHNRRQKKSCENEQNSQTMYANKQQQQQQQLADEDQGTGMKSYFSDGDFNEVLIKVNDQDDFEHSPGMGHDHEIINFNSSNADNIDGCYHQTGTCESPLSDKQRRRSSCSDAENSKRSSLSRE